jgi:hypothetical protein
MSLYYVVLMRWAELRSFAQTEQINWQLEPTLAAAFDVFATNYNATAKLYRRPPSFHEGTSGSLAQVRAALFVPSPGCQSGVSSRKTLPINVSASQWFPPEAPHSLLGSINEGGHTGWIEFTLATPSDPSWEIGAVEAVPYISPGYAGLADHTILLDGVAVHSWTGNPVSQVALRWTPAKATIARIVRIVSAKQASWVDWVSISIFSCDTLV